MSTTFEPKGEVAEWRLLHPIFQAAEVGEVVPYAALSEALGRDIRENRTPLYRAVQELEKQDSRTVAVVKDEGYRVVPAKEHEKLVRKRQTRSRRQLVKGIRTASAADRRELNAEERQRIDALQERMTRLEQMVRQTNRRVEEVESRARSTEDRSESTAAELADLRAKLIDRGYLDAEAA